MQTLEGLAPLGAALVADAVAHSIPVVDTLLTFVTEPAGAAAGVAYLFTLVLSSPKVDPKTLAPAGTVLNAKKVPCCAPPPPPSLLAPPQPLLSCMAARLKGLVACARRTAPEVYSRRQAVCAGPSVGASL